MLDARIYLTSAAWSRFEIPDGEYWHRSAGRMENASGPGIGCESDIYAMLERSNGFHATVIKGKDYVVAGVDHVRSIPLFYCQLGNALFLSDDAEWVRQASGEIEMDPTSREEFQLTGYVTGSDTLFANVKQLQAGEYLRAVEREGRLKITTDRYFQFTHNEPERYDVQVLKESLESAALNSIRRLILYADGRQIVIPLSGGYDSRLIAVLLKRLGYDRVATFTYGTRGNREAVRSRQVADALGLKWLFVEYTEQLWADAWKAPEREKYQRWASGWSSLAHLQDWLAVRVLKDCKILDADCVFAPGHSGDFIAGSHIPGIAFTQEFLSAERCAQEIIDHHYNLAPMPELRLGRSFWAKRIASCLGSRACELPWQFADTYEMWDWQERQAKFICNSVRVYEFFGYDWWMPLWDKEFVAFWGTVPLSLRQGREWYAKWVQECFEQAAPGKVVPAAQINPLLGMLLRQCRQIAAKFPTAERIAGEALRRRARRDTFLRVRGLEEREYAEGLLTRGYKHNGIFADLFLKEASD